MNKFSLLLVLLSHQQAFAGQFIPAKEAPIAGQYIVALKHAQPSTAIRKNRLAELARGHRGTLSHTYQHALNGGVMRMDETSARTLAQSIQVAYVEQDRRVRLMPSEVAATDTVAQTDVPSWGLDRIDQRRLPLSGAYNYGYSGLGVTSYVIDTGIRTSHNDFAGNASVGFDAINDGRQGQDCNGHGSHVAGIIGGLQHGVAKNTALVAVRVLDCNGSGTLGGVIAGVDWVAVNARKPAVANMSLGGGASTALDSAVTASIAKGITYVVAAGNENANACIRSPARVAEALTVAASTSTDYRASYSNHGKCVNLFAPGSAIRSTWHSSDTSTAVLSGTSMAAPHVAGVAALYLQAHPTANPNTVHKNILSTSTTKVLKSVPGGTANRLLYSVTP